MGLTWLSVLAGINWLALLWVSIVTPMLWIHIRRLHRANRGQRFTAGLPDMTRADVAMTRQRVRTERIRVVTAAGFVVIGLAALLPPVFVWGEITLARVLAAVVFISVAVLQLRGSVADERDDEQIAEDSRQAWRNAQR